MKFDINDSLLILERTPFVIQLLLEDLPDKWIFNNEGPETFSPFDVVGHLLHGEKTDWLVRVEIILSNTEYRKFQPYDRFAMYEESKGKSLQQLLDEFKSVRLENITAIKQKNISETDLLKTGIHPNFGEVTLKQLLSTWTIHDLAHIAQMCRVMSKQYTDEVGPWKEYMNILK